MQRQAEASAPSRDDEPEQMAGEPPPLRPPEGSPAPPLDPERSAVPVPPPSARALRLAPPPPPPPPSRRQSTFTGALPPLRPPPKSRLVPPPPKPKEPIEKIQEDQISVDDILSRGPMDSGAPTSAHDSFFPGPISLTPPPILPPLPPVPSLSAAAPSEPPSIVRTFKKAEATPAATTPKRSFRGLVFGIAGGFIVGIAVVAMAQNFQSKEGIQEQSIRQSVDTSSRVEAPAQATVVASATVEVSARAPESDSVLAEIPSSSRPVASVDLARLRKALPKTGAGPATASAAPPAANTEAPILAAEPQATAEAVAETIPPALMPTAEEPAALPPFNKEAAQAALAGAASAASACSQDDQKGSAQVNITFAPSGRVTQSIVTSAPFAGTAIGSCIAQAFRSITIPAFSGDRVTVSKNVNLK